jgi:alkylation response protein AidB-like acyl-CoA dehydrogenase
MMVMAARRKDSGLRNDLEAGTAKYLASEYGKEVVEGTAEIHKMIIGRRLLEEYPTAG